MTLKPYSEGLFNTLESLDCQPQNSGEGIVLDNAKAGIESYYIDQAKEEGYIIEVPRGSAKYKPTVQGIVLLNQIKLRKSIEKADVSAKRTAWINGILAVVIA